MFPRSARRVRGEHWLLGESQSADYWVTIAVNQYEP